MFKFAKRRKGKGFTLAEVLIVVAIVAVLLAVAIPNVISYYRSLKLTELDDSARTIFLAAQNRLTALKNEGRDLTKLSTTPVTVNLSGGSQIKDRLCAVTAPISPAPAGGGVDNLAVLVPGGSVEPQLHDNHYVVEIDPKTGAVYAVWYWEEYDFTYEETYSAADVTREARLKAGRMVGYYGGSTIERAAIGQTPFPVVNVTNAEELVLDITVPEQSLGASASVKAKVTISANGVTVPIISDVALKHDGYTFTGSIALDTLREATEFAANGTLSFDFGNMGKPFKEWVNTYSITPGMDFDIEVEVCADDDGYLPQYVYCTGVNSLFESVAEDPANPGNYTAQIAYGRHLQNLNKSTSGVDDSVTAAEQTRHIDFDFSATATGMDKVYSWQDTYGDTPFTPINNDKLMSYDGKELVISNLYVNHTDTFAGLFGHLQTSGSTFEYIRLENPNVTGTSYVGALVGKVDHGSIKHCGAYVSDRTHYETTCTVTGGGKVGGLIGSFESDGEISDCFAAVRVKGEQDCVGGLIGDLALSVGHIETKITNCYSGGHTDGGQYVSANVTGRGDGVGGLIGAVHGDTSYTCTLTLSGVNYSTCSVGVTTDTYLSQGEIGLLFGYDDGNETILLDSGVKNYATGVAFDENGDAITTGLHDESAYLVTDRGSNVQDPFTTYPYDETLRDVKYPYATNLLTHYGDWPDEPSAQSFCYYDNCNGTYGVWGYIVDPAGGTPAHVNSLVSGAPGAGPYAIEEGYCIPVEHDEAAPAAPKVDGISCTVVRPAVATDVTVDKSGKTYDLYRVEGLEDVGATNYYNKITVGTTEYWFNPFFACEVIPENTTPTAPTTPQAKNGAAGVDSMGNPINTYGDCADKVVIRTARQLANMAKQTLDNNDAQKRRYVQLLDIDFEQYTMTGFTTGKTTTWEPMVLSTGTFDGNKFIISNLYIDKPGENAVGLFGNTKGTLTQIRLMNIQVTGKDRVGALAGRVNGEATIINDCGVYVYAATAADYDTAYKKYAVNGNSNVGGLIGNANSEVKEIKDCFAAVKVSGKDRVGGLIGNLAASDKDGTITNCNSGGHTVGSSYDESLINVSGEKQVGGLIGCVAGDTGSSGPPPIPPEPHDITFTGVNYSTCSVGITSGSATPGLLIGDVTGAAGIVVPSGSTAYATGVAFDDSGDVATPRDESDYLTSYAANLANILAVTSGKTAATASKYDSTIGNSYPYLSADGMTHHGDWPVLQEAVFYWEQEGTGTGVATKQDDGTYSGEGYHFFAKGCLNGQPVTLNTLCETYHDVNATGNAEWGYGLYAKSNTDKLDTPKDSSNTEVGTATGKDDEGKKFASLLCRDTYDVTMLDGGTEDKACSTESKAAASQTYHLNLGFGAAIEVGTSSTMGQSGNPYKIRNVRQLDNIPDSSPSSFLQTHDMYGQGYSVYSGASGFAGTYNGQSYRILELSMTNGLFTSLNGGAGLDSIILYSPSGDATVTGNGTVAVGGLAGSVTGSGDTNITNCVVAGYSMSNASEPLGGLVGKVERATTYDKLSITNSEAVNKLNGSNVYVGGLVGHVASCSVDITNSYAGGEITNGRYVGGIVGFANTSGFTAGIVDYTNVYSYMKISGGNVKYGIGACGYSSPYDSGYYNNCYYWSGGITGHVYGDNVTAATLDQLKTCISGAGIGTVTEGHTFKPENASASGDSYPYPAVVKDHEGSYVHYGDWETD